MDVFGREQWCTKDFPKKFRNRTTVSQDSYPEYRCRLLSNGSFTHSMRVKGADFGLDNPFVVPYNPLPSLWYEAHVNVEIVESVQAVKYLCILQKAKTLLLIMRWNSFLLHIKFQPVKLSGGCVVLRFTTSIQQWKGYRVTFPMSRQLCLLKVRQRML